MIRFLALILLLIPCIANATEITFYGDLLLSRGIAKLIDSEGKSSITHRLDRFTSINAIHIANLEGAVGDISYCPRVHNPCFPIKKESISILNGFDIINLENNHSLDNGLYGLNKTIKELQRHDIRYLGGNVCSNVIKTENGNIGIIGTTDVVNSDNDRQYLCMADSPHVIEEIKHLKKICTLTTVYVHWGKELDNLPTSRMKMLARKFIEAGADMIVGTHPHVTGKIECIQSKPVIYSLGNFLFDQKYEDTKKGAILKCSINEGMTMHCRLIGTVTPANTFLPYYAISNDYKKENEILSSCQLPLQKAWTDIFSANGKEKRLLLKKDEKSSFLSYLELYDLKTGIREIKTPAMPIVKLQPFDINSDSASEIMLIQNIYSSLDNEVAKRIYIYSLDKTFRALWRGSALSRPLEDAIFIKGKNNKPILVALHSSDSFLLRNSKKLGRIIMSYRWNGFGFTGIKELKSEKDSRHLSFSKKQINLIDGKGNIIQRIAVSDLN